MFSQLHGMSPLDVAARWPANQRLMMLHSGRVHPRWARWSILASPRATWRFDGRSRWIGDSPPFLRDVHFANDPLADLDAILAATKLGGNIGIATSIPFSGGWIGYFSYDLGRVIEPKAHHMGRKSTKRPWPLIELAWCPDALVFDHVGNQWFATGNGDEALEGLAATEANHGAWYLPELRPAIDPGDYMMKVARTIEYIAAGDVFQANITQRFSAEFEGSTRALMIAAMQASRPWYGALIELADSNGDGPRSIISLSPELFMQLDACTRQVITRPIKGTRPAAGNARELIDSAKDAAELHMIVDLMRNDLGRVCRYGSVEVASSRLIESHPTVHHGVGEVSGTLCEGVSIGDLLRATFPGGSVTGAPKIRAMQIIDELEAEPRGPYCGAIGFISDCGAARLNIAIRTMLLTAHRDRPGGRLDYWAGAGIVADSIPRCEFEECLDKTAVVRNFSARPTSPHAAAVR